MSQWHIVKNIFLQLFYGLAVEMVELARQKDKGPAQAQWKGRPWNSQHGLQDGQWLLIPESMKLPDKGV